MEESHKVLLVGASGMIGNLCLHEMLKDPAFSEVEVWVRKALDVSHPKLNQRIIDLAEIENMKTGAHSVFCCLGTTIKRAGSQEAFLKVDRDYVISLARTAKREGAQNFVVISSIGASLASGNFYLHTKGEMEEGVKKAELPSVSIVRPSFLMGHRKEKRTNESIAKVIMTMFGWMLFGSLKKYKGIRDITVARAMIALIKRGTPGFNIYESDVLQMIGKPSAT